MRCNRLVYKGERKTYPSSCTSPSLPQVCTQIRLSTSHAEPPPTLSPHVPLHSHSDATPPGRNREASVAVTATRAPLPLAPTLVPTRTGCHQSGPLCLLVRLSAGKQSSWGGCLQGKQGACAGRWAHVRVGGNGMTRGEAPVRRGASTYRTHTDGEAQVFAVVDREADAPEAWTRTGSNAMADQVNTTRCRWATHPPQPSVVWAPVSEQIVIGET